MIKYFDSLSVEKAQKALESLEAYQGYDDKGTDIGDKCVCYSKPVFISAGGAVKKEKKTREIDSHPRGLHSSLTIALFASAATML